MKKVEYKNFTVILTDNIVRIIFDYHDIAFPAYYLKSEGFNDLFSGDENKAKIIIHQIMNRKQRDVDTLSVLLETKD